MSQATNLLSETLLSIDEQSNLKSYFEQSEKAYLIYAFSNPVAVDYFSSTFSQITNKIPLSYKGVINYVACEFESAKKAQEFRNKFDSVIFKIKATDTILENDYSDEWFKNTVLAETSDLLPLSAFVTSSSTLNTGDDEKIKNAQKTYQRDLKTLQVLTRNETKSFNYIIDRVKDILVNGGMFLNQADCNVVIDYYVSLMKSIPYFAGGVDEFISSKLTKYICDRKMALAESSMSQHEIMQDEGFRPLIAYNADYSSIEITKEQRSALHDKKLPTEVKSILSSVQLTDMQWRNVAQELQSVLTHSYLDNHFTDGNDANDKEYGIKQLIQISFQTFNTQLLYKSLNDISNSLNKMSMIETVDKLNLIHKETASRLVSVS
ncbi:hypothetical protein AKG60_18105 [Vibrio parahaemolyticus]|uniref:Uncharacterized protein n=1 Tax=Vibrio parahaemolyticus TaxID=670 RepID=A0AAX0M8Q4_VIBPH|nr:hypothetical protein [Vibrio parahaemolyticus]MCS0328151.1 hypothetical protein [Vibrio diabolicus]EGR3310124.1 hypothetical protein [Vibrio parahaemolyticus]EJG0023751.1 hypothetical protein [Vibrio parahaemolyticus]EJG0331759.1 hypothetical protein [Vibrio parahaemolyticus]